METLPNYVRVLRDGYTENVDWNVKQSEMESGLMKQRPGRRIAIRARQCSLVITGHANKKLFETWLNNIGGGTQYFNYLDPIDGLTKKCRFVNTAWPFELQGIDTWFVSCEIEGIG